MTMILLESSLMIIFMLVFRKLCRNVLSPRIVYALWFFTAFRLLPIECLFGRDIHMLSLNAFSRLFGKIFGFVKFWRICLVLIVRRWMGDVVLYRR